MPDIKFDQIITDINFLNTLPFQKIIYALHSVAAIIDNNLYLFYEFSSTHWTAQLQLYDFPVCDAEFSLGKGWLAVLSLDRKTILIFSTDTNQLHREIKSVDKISSFAFLEESQFLVISYHDVNRLRFYSLLNTLPPIILQIERPVKKLFCYDQNLLLVSKNLAFMQLSNIDKNLLTIKHFANSVPDMLYRNQDPLCTFSEISTLIYLDNDRGGKFLMLTLEGGEALFCDLKFPRIWRKIKIADFDIDLILLDDVKPHHFNISCFNCAEKKQKSVRIVPNQILPVICLLPLAIELNNASQLFVERTKSLPYDRQPISSNLFTRFKKTMKNITKGSDIDEALRSHVLKKLSEAKILPDLQAYFPLGKFEIEGIEDISLEEEMNHFNIIIIFSADQEADGNTEVTSEISLIAVYQLNKTDLKTLKFSARLSRQKYDRLSADEKQTYLEPKQ